MRESTVIWSLMFLLLAGCASSQGFDRPALIETLHVDPPPDQNNQPLANQAFLLSSPVRLGIFFADHNIPVGQSIRKVEWLSADRVQFLHEFAPLQDEHILTDTFVLMDATLRGEDIRGIRQAGARHGADMVLIVGGAAAIDRHNNRYAWLYPTVIGAYLAHGTESDALVMVTGSLWAVHSEWHAPIQTVEGVSKLVGSAVLVDDTAALQEAKKQAIQFLCERVADQLQRLNKRYDTKLPSR